MQRVTPYLLYPDGEAALAFLESAFGFRVVEKTVGSQGGLHAELETPGGGRLYVGQPSEPKRDSMQYVIVDDVESLYEQVRASGAEITEELSDLPFGHRRFSCTDPQGGRWSFAQVVE